MNVPFVLADDALESKFIEHLNMLFLNLKGIGGQGCEHPFTMQSLNAKSIR